MTTKSQSGKKTRGGVDATLIRNGGLSYLEIPAADARRSASFYQKVLGWNVTGADTDRPKFQDQTGHLIGRWVTGRAISREPGLLPYIYVDRIDEVVKRVEGSGGTVIEGPRLEGNLLVATLRDPAGNVIGLWEEAEPQGG